MPIATDLYLRGNNVAGFSPINNTAFQFQAGQIEFVGIAPYNMISSKAYNLTGYTKVNMEAKSTQGLSFTVYKNGEYNGSWSGSLTSGNGTIYYDISDFRMVTKIEIRVSKKGYIYRIWLS